MLGKSVPFCLRATGSLRHSTLSCSAAVLARISCLLRSSMYFFLLFSQHVLRGDISEGSLYGGERESCLAVKQDWP
jgi:hypothetical protein